MLAASWLQQPVKHGRGTKGAASASDAAGRGDARGTPLPARPAASGHVAFIFLKPTRIDAAPNRADSRGIGPIRACIGRNRPYRPESAILAVSAETADSSQNSKKKKKKGAKQTVWTKS